MLNKKLDIVSSFLVYLMYDPKVNGTISCSAFYDGLNRLVDKINETGQIHLVMLKNKEFMDDLLFIGIMSLNDHTIYIDGDRIRFEYKGE